MINGEMICGRLAEIAAKEHGCKVEFVDVISDVNDDGELEEFHDASGLYMVNEHEIQVLGNIEDEWERVGTLVHELAHSLMEPRRRQNVADIMEELLWGINMEEWTAYLTTFKLFQRYDWPMESFTKKFINAKHDEVIKSIQDPPFTSVEAEAERRSQVITHWLEELYG
jgi:hypothetical protein